MRRFLPLLLLCALPAIADTARLPGCSRYPSRRLRRPAMSPIWPSSRK